MRISLLLPTRQRPSQLLRMVGSALATADNPELLELVTFIDDDDASYDGVNIDDWGLKWTRVRGPRLHDGQVNLSVKWNDCFAESTGDILMHCGDDIVFRTNGWDTAVRDAINSHHGKIAFVWCNDIDFNTDMSHFGTHGFVHRNWTDVVGRFVPPYFVSDFNDTWFNDVAKLAGVCHYLPHHLTEHMHYIWGKAVKDANTEDRLQRHAELKPELLYRSQEMMDQRADEARKLTQFVKEQGDDPIV